MSPDLVDRWNHEGWLHLRAVVPRGAIDRVNALVDELWRAKPRRVTVDDLDAGTRTRMAALDNSQRSHRIKINDLYLEYAAVRAIFLDHQLRDLVAQLMGDVPVLCNTLNLERSSAQEYHADSLYMTPRTEDRMVAAWVALDDVIEGSGPLRLYRGSHRFPPFTFSNGSRHAVQAELPRWAAHMQQEIDGRSLRPHVVFASVGDVILWHADLLHGAEEIKNPNLLRKSMIGHYFALLDCEISGYRIANSEGGRWIVRLPQAVDLPSRIAVALERRWIALRASARHRRSQRSR